ncbi:hypothetical protein [Mesorhizobium sp. M8A.F.Ca.ET.165.01.1.1]|uniref:hypothetical protein n=1 Tax=Mesorhizobium sp. M8A.F.Ca.ET.165.01.1.1 TaxID=2563960 RepID=UPI0010936CB7|nr:hypothetical protein [Mesorhizobium sp. M8A.F.Ca.ET.165.01.1.1]TGT42786.1 hypothetical protein EN808_12960 [Mesorhizobium sp. M8A.F.Ca.ET.165.01.1.1]
MPRDQMISDTVGLVTPTWLAKVSGNTMIGMAAYVITWNNIISVMTAFYLGINIALKVREWRRK